MMAMSSIKQTNNSSTQTTSNSDQNLITSCSQFVNSGDGGACVSGVSCCNNVVVTSGVSSSVLSSNLVQTYNTSVATSTINHQQQTATAATYLKCGYLRKQKTNKKKFFVLKPETVDSLARLEYYDDEKKWRNNKQPKRSIILKTCFNINRHKRNDIKQKYVIDLFTKDDCFSIAFENEDELDEWLRPMLFLQHGEELLMDGEPPKPTFEHVWPVEVMERGLGSQSKIRGAYRLCLTDQKLSLVPNGNSKLNTLEFSLMGIRRCGASNNFLYIEVGRSSVTGEGDIYMATTDPVIACNMRDIILQAMSNSKKDDFDAKQRKRSNSDTDSGKPVTSRRPYKFAESSGNVYSVDRSPLPPLAAVTPSAAVVQWCALQRAAAQRRHSVSAVVGTNNGPFNNNAANGVAVTGSTQNPSQLHTSHQRTHSLPVSPADTNHYNNNETNNNYAPMSMGISLLGSSSVTSSYTCCQTSSSNTNNSFISTMTPTSCQVATVNNNSSQATIDQVDCFIPPRRGSIGNRNTNNSTSNKRHNRSSGLSGTLSGLISGDRSGGTFRDNISNCLTGRDRSDTFPTRARTTSEGPQSAGTTTSRTIASIVHHMRPRSMYTHDGPASPPSNCSTDSAGSSLSIDETDWAGDVCVQSSNDCLASLSSRYGHSLTPDEHNVIFEENDEWDRPSSLLSSSSLPKNSPNISSGIHSESPSGTSCGSSPLDVNAGYVPMCPSDTGYVPMCPSDTGYVPMNLSGYVPMGPVNNDNYRVSPAASNCSITSGTPSTDLRFSEYHLDKVTSYIPIDNCEFDNGRPLRTYSVGSKPTQQRNNIDSSQLHNDTSYRVRALSVGSHNKKGGMRRNLKASSAPAPLVAGSPMGDLMELDFTQNKSTTKLNSTRDTSYVDMSGSLSASPNNKSINHSNYSPYVDMSGKSSSPKSHDDSFNLWRSNNETPTSSSRTSMTNDGYMDMSYNKRKQTLSQSSNASDDYLNMSGVNNNKSTSSSSNKRSKDRREKARSKPIAIQPMSSSPKNGPPTYLPLQQTTNQSPTSPFSTLQRNRNRKSESTAINSTPTSTVFSASSSTTTASQVERKCPVDGTSGTIRIYDDYAPMKISGNETNNRTTSISNDDEYTEISFGNQNEQSDYVNYNPSQQQPRSLPITRTDTDGDYAIMQPRQAIRKTSVPLFNTINSIKYRPKMTNSMAPQVVQIVKPGANMTNHPQSSFKPITANLPKVIDNTNKASTSPKTVDNLLTRQLSSLNQQQQNLDTTSPPIDLLRACSITRSENQQRRPNSVNSETATTSSTVTTPRPSSVSSESSLSRSRPSSSSSDLNSSSSTLVGSRPPSVSSERELHYITLEHETVCSNEAGTKSPRCCHEQSTPPTCQCSSNCVSACNSSVTTTSPSSSGVTTTTTPVYQYTSIDFVATDGLKQNTTTFLPIKH
ncbi:serine-rich adhesin for platelets isoform X2 [Chrysoperla carnea]|uniref:serine-rich adhesin for platelets isoform X2 n=1 Tax=Chrysoperla carnea TaxID=189513 RepID=UPI001D05F658|nr:serine-rich adhesin for platelets isoform X2 [Chrysoperla carnea]